MGIAHFKKDKEIKKWVDTKDYNNIYGEGS